MPIEVVGGGGSHATLYGGGAASLSAPDMLPALRTGEPLQSSQLLKGESSSASATTTLQQQQTKQKPHLILEESTSSSCAATTTTKCSPQHQQQQAQVSLRCTSPSQTSATTTLLATSTRIVMANGRILYRPIPIKPVRPLWLQKRLLLQQQQSTSLSLSAVHQQTAAVATVGASGVVPEQIVQDFYDTAESQGLSDAAVQEAAVQAAEWHRKWTMQDERNHTAPEAQEEATTAAVTAVDVQAEKQATSAAVVQEEKQAAASTPVVVPLVEEEEEEASLPKSLQTPATTPPTTGAALPDSLHALFDAALVSSDMWEQARLAAGNPSPEEEESAEFSSRFLIDCSILSESCDSATPSPVPTLPQHEQQENRPVYKRRFSETCHVIPDKEQVLIRPMAIRVMRPQAMRPMDYYFRQFHLAGSPGSEGGAVDQDAVDAMLRNTKQAEEEEQEQQQQQQQSQQQQQQHCNVTIPKNVLSNWRTATRSGSGHLSPLTLSSLGTMDESKSAKRNRTTSPTRHPSVPVLSEHEEEYEHHHHHPEQVVCVAAPPAESVVLISSTEQMLRNKDRNLPTEIIHTNRHLSCHRLTACNSTSMSEAADSDDSSLSCRSNATDVMEARDGLLHSLAIQGGNVPVKADGSSNSQRFYECLDVLQEQFADLAADTRHGNDPFAPTVEGCWLTLTSPTYFGCLGLNDNSDPMYTLGRMAFDMFSPTSLVCSLQGNFNTVHAVSDANRAALLADSSVPKALREEVQLGETTLRTYNVVTAFTIEPNLAAYPTAPNKDVRRPIRGLMTTYGYTLPDPEIPNRHSVWITGGRIEPNNDSKDQGEWKAHFARHPPKHGLAQQAKLLAVKLLMGAQIAREMNVDDGSMEYTFSRPLGGHGLAFIDVLYVDESLRVVRGHRGTIFCFSRLPGDYSP
jgi:hypothetical protein